ncbi:endonuclease domain-containing protein [Acinetobacter ursingii]|uniref:endonuclease domain-containing protein n=1 Tax=Acinetobacter ursingii TaxID=108980 RepID=UPI00300B278A
MKSYNKNLKLPSRDLRKNMTDAEQVLWQSIRRKQILGLQFYRQKPLLNFIVDFYCPAADLVIECDGGQHYTEDGLAADKSRDHALNELGLMVLRFSNHEILTEIDGVVEVIYEFFTSNRFKINNILLIDF